MTELEPVAEDEPRQTPEGGRAARREAARGDTVDAELIPEEVQDAIARTVEMHLEHYSSPHPHPDHLERYAALYPDAPKIVFDSFRDQGDHRRKMEEVYLRGSERRANIGQWLAFILVAGVIGVGVYALAIGQGGVGATVITVGLGGGILLAISGARQRAASPAKKPRATQRGTAKASQSEIAKRPSPEPAGEQATSDP